MRRPCLADVGDPQAGVRGQPLDQLGRAEPEELGEVRDDDPGLASRREPLGEPGHEPRQERAARIVDGALEGRRGVRREPGRVRDHDVGAVLAGGEEIRFHDLDAAREPEPLRVLAGAHDRARL